MSMKKTAAIAGKQCKDVFKNKEILIQFLLFPIMAVIMENSIDIDGMQEHFFVVLFATMYVGMAPLTIMASIISEEKEKNTLKMLLLSNVKPTEYLVGVGGLVWLFCMLGAIIFGVTGGYKGREMAAFLLIMAAGIITALVIGAAIGNWSRNQMMATSVAVIVMVIFSFLPMIGIFNDTVEKIAEITYSQQINNLIGQIGSGKEIGKSVIIIAANMAGAGIIFNFAYRKSGLC